jgi:hypothetical protein
MLPILAFLVCKRFGRRAWVRSKGRKVLTEKVELRVEREVVVRESSSLGVIVPAMFKSRSKGWVLKA